MAEDKLKAIRERIDALDEQIQALISARARCAQEVAALKSGGDAVIFYRPEREAEVLRMVIARNQGPRGAEEMARLFREIMSACLALEQPLRIGYLGPEGTFTQAAALKHFGHSVLTVAHHAIDEVFRDVEAGSCHYGVVPVENSTEGVVTHTLDMFLNSPLKIVGEVQLRIHHNILSKADTLTAVRRVYAHHQALALCREWLDEMLAPFARHGISMSRIESRPSRRGVWEYVFFVDIEGHGADPVVAEALSQLAAEAAMLKVLGSYPRAVL